MVFSDLDNDGDPEVVAATDIGNILALHLDGSYVTYFPIINNSPSSGSPMVIDLDGDNDLEIIAGSGSNLFVVDVKNSGSIDNYWNVYRGGNNRRGNNFVQGNCTDPQACNYDPNALVNNGSCFYKRNNEDCSGNCLSGFSKDDCGACGGDNSICSGCTNSDASNYDLEAIIDDGSCILEIKELLMIPEIYSISNIHPIHSSCPNS